MVLKKKTRVEVRKKKYTLWLKLWDCLDKYKKVLAVKCSNITAHIFHDIRQALRPYDAVIVMGKNTLLKAGIHKKMDEPKEGDEDFETRKQKYKPMPQLEKLAGILNGYMGLIFCNDHLSDIKSLLKNYQCNKGAKIGVSSPCDVILPPGPTGLDPKQTSFFQALNIQTKIVKAQIEIMNPCKIISKGQKITASECSLCDRLGIRPFNYDVEVLNVYDDGELYDPKVLDIKKEDIFAKLRKGAANLTAVSLHAGYPTTVSVKQSLMRGFKYLVASSLDTPYVFAQAKELKAAILNPAAAPKAVVKTEEKKEEAKKVVEEKVEEPVAGLGDIFGDN